MNYPELRDMLKAGTHFGHQASRWYPKMAEYIFGTRNEVHIIDLEKTLEKLQAAAEFVRETVGNGGTILFVGTKTQAKDLVKAAAIDCGMPHITNRWLGGTLTNFGQIRGRVKRFLDLKDKQAKGELGKYTKKEQLLFSREIEDLEEKFGGIARLERLPDALFVIDIKYEDTAVREANRTGVRVVAICDTNVDPTTVSYPIPGNDDAVRSIELFCTLMVEAVKEGTELSKTRAHELNTKTAAEVAESKPRKA